MCPCTRTSDFQALTLVSLGFLTRDTVASLPCGTVCSCASHKLSVHSAGNPASSPLAKASQVLRWTCSCSEVTHREQLQPWADCYPEMPFHTILMQHMKPLKDMTQIFSSLPLWKKKIWATGRDHKGCLWKLLSGLPLVMGEWEWSVKSQRGFTCREHVAAQG